MSVVILGGNECMEQNYKRVCRDFRHEAKVMIKPVGGVKRKMGSPDLVIFFTGAADISEDDTYRLESAEERRILADKTYRIWSQAKERATFIEIPQQETPVQKMREAKLVINAFLYEEIFT